MRYNTSVLADKAEMVFLQVNYIFTVLHESHLSQY